MEKITQQGQYWHIVGEVVFSNASMLLEATNSFDKTHQTIVDFAQVTIVDTSAISLMLEWRRRATALQSSISFENLSPNLLSLIDLYGVEEMILETSSHSI